MNFKQIFAICIIIAIAQSLTTIQKDLDSSKSSYIPQAFRDEQQACMDTFYTAYVEETENGDVEEVIKNYTKFIGDSSVPDAVVDNPANTATTTYQSNVCRYAKTIDASDALYFYNVSKACYQTTVRYDGVSNGGDAYDALVSCLDDVMLYASPYTERQFQNCQTTCADGLTVTVTIDRDELETMESDGGFGQCVYESSACGRFYTLNYDDASASGYSTNYKACFTDGCFGDDSITGDDSDYVTCVEKCEMPDYAGEILNNNSSVLSSSLVVLLLCILAF